jgi:tetratricopeptide (TPR) repeat protein
VLDALVRRRPGHSLALALRGMLRRDRLDLAGAREDLDRAAAQEPRAWILSHRADVLNRMGFYKLALEDMKRLAAAMPRAAEPRAQAANILFDQAYYKEALAEMRAAVARRPGDPALRARLATFLQVLGLLAEAERELRAVERLEPGNEQARYQRLLTAIRRGRAASALRELSRGALPKLLADHLRGYADARAGRWAQARRRFEAVAAADPSGPWARKAEFYALVARVLQDPAVRRERPKPDPWITLCGIGILHPYELTLEGLLALTECDTIFNNLGDPQVDEFLALFPARVRAVSRVFGEPAMGRARRIVATLRRGRRAGFVTRIHPFIYRRIANDLVELCRSKRIPFEAFPGVSLTEFAWGLGRAALPADRASRPRLRVFDIGFATRRPDLISARDASVFYCIAGDRERSALAGALRASREASLETALLAGSGDREHQVSRHRVDEVEAPLVAADGGAVLYVPAGGGRR